MRSHQGLRVIPRAPAAPLAVLRDDPPRHRAAASRVVLWAERQDLAVSLERGLTTGQWRVEARPTLARVTDDLVSDPSAAAALAVSASPACRAALRQMPESVKRRAVLIVRRHEAGALHEVLLDGFGDFAVLPISKAELLARIELRLGDAQQCTRAWGRGDATVELTRRDATRTAPRLSGLSPREHAVYAYLLEREGRAVSRAELLASIWHKSVESTRSSNIVDVYICYLREKLSAIAPAERIETIAGMGYMLRRG